MPSDFLTVNLKDWSKGFIIAVISAVLTIIYSSINNGGLTAIDWDSVLQVAVTAAVGYILKNLTTNSNGDFMKGER
jgi:hypothetical protein